LTAERAKFDTLPVGLLAGVLGTALGGLLLGQWWAWANGTSFQDFYKTVVLGSQIYRDSILTASTLLNVVLFWVANRMGWERIAQGLLGVILITVPFIVYFQSTAGTL
jgi:hypothetical protein